ncbi:hypothetical protein pEaSNUABM38_00173 [Erwinia phage pEa_SNUABM_38]|nr:hypothetical protein pEaSNUABM38_00173 [Erwinia phage pEa_SNUABM_38]
MGGAVVIVTTAAANAAASASIAASNAANNFRYSGADGDVGLEMVFVILFMLVLIGGGVRVTDSKWERDWARGHDHAKYVHFHNQMVLRGVCLAIALSIIAILGILTVAL